MSKSANAFALGLRRHTKDFLLKFLACLGVFWTVVEFTSAFFDFWLLKHWILYMLVVFLSIIISIIFTRSRSHISISIDNTDTNVSIKFSNLFDERSHKAIPVNEFFDREIGELVSPNSLHGQFIARFFSRNLGQFDTLTDQSLKDKSGRTVKRAKGRPVRYGLGTTAVVPAEGHKAFLFALSRTDLKSHKASADVGDLWTALDGLWKQVRIDAENEPVAIPLVGAGLSGVGLPPSDLLHLIFLSIVEATKNKKITSRIEIILLPELFDQIDLAAFKNLRS